MRLSHLFFTTLRDDPADAEMPSHRLLVRAGYVRQLGAGIYSLLPLGYRVSRRVEQVIREEIRLPLASISVHFTASISPRLPEISPK
jgi:prolyl-tRNA synthetase